MAHPAMAASAMLVLVVTAAGTFYLRGTDQFARPEPPGSAERSTASSATAPAAPVAPAATAPVPEAAHADGAPSEQIAAPGSGLAGPSGRAEESGGFAAGSGASPARLDEIAGRKADVAPRPATAKPAAPDALGDRGGPYARPPYGKAKAGGAGRDAELRTLSAAEEPPAQADKAEKFRGIELRSPQLMPKDLPGDLKKSEKQSEDYKPAPARREVRNDGRAAGQSAPDPAASMATASGGAAPAAAPALEPAPPPAANNASNAQGDRRIGKTANAANADTARQPQAQADDSAARDPALLAWARKQREQVIALVSSNRCRDAASAAVEIYNRAPDYFNANIVTDREIKPCLAYVNDQRQRAERSRAAAKNAADAPAPAPQAPTRK
jgi:hypothetical protein